MASVLCATIFVPANGSSGSTSCNKSNGDCFRVRALLDCAGVATGAPVSSDK